MQSRPNWRYALPAMVLSAWAGRGPATGQSAAAAEAEPLRVERATSAIRVDGVLDDAAWSTALTVPLRYEWFPADNTAPPVETEFLLTYDDSKLYMAFRAHDPDPAEIRAHLMDRDLVSTFVQDDHVVVVLDTFDDERRGFELRVNPLGVQMDAIFSEVEGIEDFSVDLIWESAGRIDEQGYTVEIAVPFNQLRFPRSDQPQVWGFDVGRSYPRTQRHRISGAPRRRDVSCILCQALKIGGLEGLEPGRNLELDPTLTATRSETRDDFPQGPLESDGEEVEGGLTARWGITPSLTFLGTLNPDFSQVEADAAQLAVNERFALFFEEKRPFFLEGVDIFSTPVDAVFTRTVVDPKWGAKLTGKEGRNGFGLFVARDDVTSLLIPSNQSSRSAFLESELDNAVLRYRRDLGKGSSLGVLYTGREGEDYSNRVGGIDGFVRFSDTDTLELQLLRSETRYPDQVVLDFDQQAGTFEGDALSLDWNHEARRWIWSAEYRNFDPGFRADSGFVRRVDLEEAEAILTRRWWGRDETWWDRVDLGLFVSRSEDHEGRLTDEQVDLYANFQGPLQSFVEVSVERDKELFQGVLYEDLERAQVYGEMQPSGRVRLELFTDIGEVVDVNNNQPADQVLLAPVVEVKAGRHLNLMLDHTLQRLHVEGGQLLEANLSQLRAVYNFNVRTFVRAIFQYREISRNPSLFSFPVEARTETLFSQFLFSYKINAKTVLFLGYSDDSLGTREVDLTRTDRTLFLKLGYAWIR